LQVRPYGPVPDPDHQAARLMAALTEADFPDSSLLISAEGQVQLKPARVSDASLPVTQAASKTKF